MKRSTVIWFAGGAIVVGAVVYGIYKYLQKHKGTTVDTQYIPNDNRNCTIAPEVVHDDISWGEDIVIDFKQTQQDTVASIRKHHQEATHQLENILNEMAQDSAEFEEKINQVNDNLDELLK